MGLVRPLAGRRERLLAAATPSRRLTWFRTMKNIFSGLALCVPLAAFAQAPAPAAAASSASTPALRYSSAFADYKPWQDIKPGDWRQLNDNVAPKDGQGGGHAGHGAAAPPAAPAAKASAPAAPAAGGHHGHQGHHMQGGQK